MLSFKIVSSDNYSALKSEVISALPSVDREEIEGIFRELEGGIEEGCEYALSTKSGCVLIRIYDGEYLFSYPVALENGANENVAIDKIREYAVMQEIPLVICDIPGDRIGEIIPLFRHISIDAADGEGEYYTLRAMSELSLISDIPSATDGMTELSPLKENDRQKYAALCRDEETNRYWGFDYQEDCPDADDGYFLENAENELNRGVALSLAVREGGEFAGEAILYSFDLQGGVQCAVRILPEYRCRGIAKKALSMLSDIASEMGLIYLYGTVNRQNIPSVKMCEGFFDSYTEEDENTIFIKKL